MTREDLERQLEIETHILEGLARGTSINPGTEGIPGIAKHRGYIDGQANRVLVLQQLLEEMPEPQTLYRGKPIGPGNRPPDSLAPDGLLSQPSRGRHLDIED